MASVQWDHGQATLAGLVARLTDETGALLRDVLRLASAEAGASLVELRRAALLLAAAGGALLVGLMLACAAAVAALSQLVPLWAAALVTAVAVLAGGAGLGLLAVARLRRVSAAPRETIDALKEGVHWLRAPSDT